MPRVDDGLDNNFADAQGLISYEQWEERVFLRAVMYSVVVPHGRGQITTKWYRTYPEAMVISMHTPRSLLYVKTASGRAVCIRRQDFGKYLKVYNRETGQRLRMPPDPLIVEAEREPTTAPRKRVRIQIK
jgi:hypothetical protein